MGAFTVSTLLEKMVSDQRRSEVTLEDETAAGLALGIHFLFHEELRDHAFWASWGSRV